MKNNAAIHAKNRLELKRVSIHNVNLQALTYLRQRRKISEQNFFLVFSPCGRLLSTLNLLIISPKRFAIIFIASFFANIS